MGVVEDSEPPLKRVKTLVGESNSVSRNLSVSDIANSSLGDLMARPLTSQGDGETIGSKGVIKKSEFIRIITRALYSLGYEKSGALLEEESGIPLHTSMVKLFLQQVTDGKWDESVATLRNIGLSDEKMVKAASFLLLEQKFFELLKVDKIAAALHTLRNEISPLGTNTRQVHELASCIITTSKHPGNSGANSRLKLLEKLQTLLPPSVIIPERRLEDLVEKSLNLQRESCVFHNTLDSDLSLYSDHQCGKHQIPSQTLQILHSHSDEVWFVQFSHRGKYLASASRDQSAIIWEVEEDGRITKKHTLTGHQKPVIAVLWSSDDSKLLTCGQEEAIRSWDVDSGECIHVYEKNGLGSISCGWYPNGKLIFAGMTDRTICMWDLEGRELECLKGYKMQKISDMVITNNGKWIISTPKDVTLLLLDREAKSERLIEEEDAITSFSLSRDGKYLLVNLANQEIHLWSIEGEVKILSRYKGHKRTRFVIRSCFGGYEEAFIASGSEDSQVYIWHRSSREPLSALPGHSGAVNSVSWNPTNLHMLASASDDGTIRIWGLDRFKPKPRCHENGFLRLCNGN